MAETLGDEHGITVAELDALAPRMEEIIAQVARERESGQHEYRTLPCRNDLRDQVQTLCDALRPGCEAVMVLGIGGSALGTIALRTALLSPLHNQLPWNGRKEPRLFVMDNVDPVEFAAVLDALDDHCEELVVNVISKSGGTTETLAQFLAVREWLEKRVGTDRVNDRIVVTTDPEEGLLRKLVKAAGYRSLPVPKGVGGRFSVLSPVGLFPAGMCGIDIDHLLAGAQAMDERINTANLHENPAAMIAAIHYIFYRRGKPLSVMMPYSYQLKDLADWYRQLWAESLGKQFDLDGKEVFVGPTPIKALGATDQHSQVQLYREGPNDKVITFLEVGRFERDVDIPPAPPELNDVAYLGGSSLGTLLNREKLATERALLKSHRPCLTVRFPKVNAHTVGQFIYLYEVATTLSGYLFGIEPYDQPAVELGKRYTRELMQEGDSGEEDTGPPA